MDIKAKAKHIRMSPKKVRLVADMVRGKETKKSLAMLKFTNKKAALPVSKLISSAVNKAENNYELDKNNLFIKEIRVNEGMTMKRWKPRAYGRATQINKRMSHIDLILGEIKDSGIVKAKKQEVEKPINLEEAAKKAQAENKKTAKKDTKKTSESKIDKAKKATEEKQAPNSKNKQKAESKKGFANKIFQRKSG